MITILSNPVTGQLSKAQPEAFIPVAQVLNLLIEEPSQQSGCTHYCYYDGGEMRK